ncbi:MAG: YCF48-related protein [Candidatus Sulfotelmatobacter sp.]|jgi:hypothetical protein
MQKVPKIVRERLKAAPAPAPHPDADVLTAFTERSLPEHERGVVLEHLARCGDCRDVVALALPEPEAMQTVFAPARGGWLAWPALRWGFVAAGVVTIAAVGVIQLQRHQALTSTKQMARVEAPASPAQNQPTASSLAGTPAENKEKSLPVAPAPNAFSAGKDGLESGENRLIARAVTPTDSIPRQQIIGGVASGVAHNQFPHGPQMPTQWQQQNTRAQGASPVQASVPVLQAANHAANLKIPPSSQMVAVEASNPVAPVNNEAQTQNQGLQLQAQSAPSSEGGPIGGPVGKAKPVVNVEAANLDQTAADATAQQELPTATGNPGITARSFTQLTAPAPSRLPRWNISSSGALQRSFDQGKTWQDVDVNANLVAGGNFSAANYSSVVVLEKPARAKESSADKKDLKEPAAVVFRAVAASGTEVWAGGSNGALYHSLDAGGHWAQVMPSFNGMAISGDVVSVGFSDAQHGKVTTSTAEVWITSDDGQTWQKQ